MHVFLSLLEMPGIKQRRALAAIEEEGGGGGGHSQLGEYFALPIFLGSCPDHSWCEAGQHRQQWPAPPEYAQRVAGATSLATSWSAVSMLLYVPNNRGAQQVGHKDDPSTCVLLEALGGRTLFFIHGLLAQNGGSLVKAFWRSMVDTPMFAAKHAAWASKGHNLDKVMKRASFTGMLAKATPEPWVSHDPPTTKL